MKSRVRARRSNRVKGRGFRLQLRRPLRALWTAVLCLTTAFFIPAVLGFGIDLAWRALSMVGLITSLIGLRIVWGPAIVVGEAGLRVYRTWPLHRDFPWYRILEVDIIPGFWNIEVEMNSGERLELPCVEHLDWLYESIEKYRSNLDAA